MDYEREPGSDLGGESPDEPADQQPTGSAVAGTQPESSAAEPVDDSQQPTDTSESEPAPNDHVAAQPETSESGEAQHDDAGHTDWPAADFAGSAAADEPADPDDDSDAPIELDDDSSAPSGPLPDHVRGETVNLKQGGVQTIHASTVTITQGGAGRVNADTLTMEQSGVGLARTRTLTLGSGATAVAVVANEATVQKGGNAMFLVARSFGGDVQPTIDWRTALAFGVGLGFVLSIIRRLR